MNDPILLLDDTPDRALAQAVMKGHEPSFRILYRRHTPAVFRVVARMLGDGAADVEDVVQDAWVKAVRALPGFRWESSLRTWLSGIAINRTREVLRKAGRRLDDQPLPLRGTPSRPDPTDTRMDLEAALTTLPDGYRTVLLLHDWEGFTHPEIAAHLDIAVGTSRSQLFHARRALRHVLGESDGARST